MPAAPLVADGSSVDLDREEGRPQAALLKSQWNMSAYLLLLQELAELAPDVTLGTRGGLGVSRDRCALPKAGRHVARGWQWSQDARKPQRAAGTVIRVREMDVAERDVVEGVVCSRVERDRRVLTGRSDRAHELGARSGWRPVIELARVNTERGGDALALGVDGVAVRVEGEECAEGRLPPCEKPISATRPASIRGRVARMRSAP